MKAVELKFADSKPTGIWYCGKCREIFKQFESRSGVADDFNREKAEECCTGATRWVPEKWVIGGVCTGCRRSFELCICGRAAKNCCVSCGTKLFQQEGIKVRWGADEREICYACSVGPAKKLVEAAK